MFCSRGSTGNALAYVPFGPRPKRGRRRPFHGTRKITPFSQTITRRIPSLARDLLTAWTVPRIAEFDASLSQQTSSASYCVVHPPQYSKNRRNPHSRRVNGSSRPSYTDDDYKSAANWQVSRTEIATKNNLSPDFSQVMSKKQ